MPATMLKPLTKRPAPGLRRPEEWTRKGTWEDQPSKKQIFEEDKELEEEASTSEEEGSFHSHRDSTMETESEDGCSAIPFFG